MNNVLAIGIWHTDDGPLSMSREVSADLSDDEICDKLCLHAGVGPDDLYDVLVVRNNGRSHEAPVVRSIDVAAYQADEEG